MKKFSDGVRQKVLELHIKGMVQREIAEYLNISETTVGRVLKKAGVLSHKQVRENKIKVGVAQMYVDNLSPKEIAKALNISVATVERSLRNAGKCIQTRKYRLICIFCGEKFNTSSPNAKYCSGRCQRVSHIKSQDCEDRICAWCSESYIFKHSTSGNQMCKKVTCSETCDKEYQRYKPAASRYKLHPREYKRLIKTQCKVCGSKENLCIDHDHSCCPERTACGKCIRGVLCGACNKSEGHLKTFENAYNLSLFMTPRLNLIEMLNNK